MTPGSTIFALRWLINDTVRQSLAGNVFWIMLGVSVLAIVFCASISVEGGTVVDQKEIYTKSGQLLEGKNPEPGTLSLLFGTFQVAIHRGAAQEVQLIHVFLATWVAGAVGLLLALIFTASFMTEFLQPSSAVVLLAKPAPRWLFLAGKYLGVVLIVAGHSLVFFLGTWLTVGLRTGVWNNTYLLGWPMLVVQFAVFYSVSVVIAVGWRSTVACVLGIALFWAICLGVNYGRYAAIGLTKTSPTEARALSPITTSLVEAGYWILPKPADYMVLLEDAIDARTDRVTMASQADFQYARERGDFQPVAILATSLLFGVLAIMIAGHQLSQTEY